MGKKLIATPLIVIEAVVKEGKTKGRLRLNIAEGISAEEATKLLLGATFALSPEPDPELAVFADGALADQLYNIFSEQHPMEETDV